MSTVQVCTRCVMDETDPEISFDENGVCSHCHKFDSLMLSWPVAQYIATDAITQLMNRVKSSKRGSYDSIVGLSGGVDSSYVAYLAKQHGLNPLCVHLDNGWNSELSVQNIHSIVNACGFDLHTHVIDWEEFRDVQRSFFKANVVDIEMVTDHAIFAVIINLAWKKGIRYVLSGANHATEAVMPKSWVHRKQDLRNLKNIHAKFGQVKLKTFPMASTLRHVFLMYGLGFKVAKPLNFIDYNKEKAMEILEREFGWQYYGGKHYESIFTKFYQAHILPNKFNIDKRKAHLSTLICSNQITREQALEELKKPLYDPEDFRQDYDFVLKKLNFTDNEFQNYMKAPAISHYQYGSDEKTYQALAYVRDKVLKPSTAQ